MVRCNAKYDENQIKVWKTGGNSRGFTIPEHGSVQKDFIENYIPKCKWGPFDFGHRVSFEIGGPQFDEYCREYGNA